MNHVLLLFDIDGTLLRTNGVGMRAMANTACHLHGPNLSWEGISAAGHLDPLLFAEAMQLNGIPYTEQDHLRFRDHYLEELANQLQQHSQHVQALPGVHDLIDHLHQQAANQAGLMLGLLTGNYSQAVPLKLRAIDIDPGRFPITAFGDEAPTRPDLVKLAMQRYTQQTSLPARPRRVVVIGDTLRDVHCAHANGCIAFAVATGGNQAHELRQAGADVVVDDLSDPQPLLDLIARL